MNTGIPGGSPPIQPRRARSAGNTCLIAGLSGCGLGLLILVGFGIYAAKKAGPGLKGFLSGVSSGPACKQKLTAIEAALEEYLKQHNGKYPPKLEDLIPNYLPDNSNFTYSSSPSEPVINITYHPPSPNEPGSAILAGFKTGTTEMVPGQTLTISIDLLKDGEIVEDSLTRQELP